MPNFSFFAKYSHSNPCRLNQNPLEKKLTRKRFDLVVFFILSTDNSAIVITDDVIYIIAFA